MKFHVFLALKFSVKMGNMGSRLSRPFKNWNIESRAHKLIGKEEPRPAPTFPSTSKQIDLVNKC